MSRRNTAASGWPTRASAGIEAVLPRRHRFQRNPDFGYPAHRLCGCKNEDYTSSEQKNTDEPKETKNTEDKLKMNKSELGYSIEYRNIEFSKIETFSFYSQKFNYRRL